MVSRAVGLDSETVGVMRTRRFLTVAIAAGAALLAAQELGARPSAEAPVKRGGIFRVVTAGIDSIAVTGKAGASAWKLSRMTPIDG